MTLTNDGKGLKSQSRLRKLRCFRESFKHRHTERDKDLQYSSCLLVIGTFQTGYCRVNIDRKLLAGDCENHHQCISCADADMCSALMPLSSANYAGPWFRWWQKPSCVTLFSSLFSSAVIVRACGPCPDPPHTQFLAHVISVQSGKCFHSLTKVSLFTQCLH